MGWRELTARHAKLIERRTNTTSVQRWNQHRQQAAQMRQRGAH